MKSQLKPTHKLCQFYWAAYQDRDARAYDNQNLCLAYIGSSQRFETQPDVLSCCFKT